jgi:hypothetical protein
MDLVERVYGRLQRRFRDLHRPGHGNIPSRMNIFIERFSLLDERMPIRH